MRCAITISLVEQARGGPFVYWDGLEDGCRRAAAAGADAVELFVPSADAVEADTLRGLLDEHNLKLAAVGTGAGMVLHGLSLTHRDADHREKARDFVRSIIDFAAGFGAPAIIGSMQGKHGDGVDRETALDHLHDALDTLGQHAGSHDTVLMYEPLNRYETNLVNTIEAGTAMLDTIGHNHVRLLADLFHMNIEEADLGEAIRRGGKHIGHVHFVDSNRRAAGLGHIDYGPIAQALRAIDYDGYLCAEALPLPDSDTAATQTVSKFHELFK